MCEEDDEEVARRRCVCGCVSSGPRGDGGAGAGAGEREGRRGEERRGVKKRRWTGRGPQQWIA